MSEQTPQSRADYKDHMRGDADALQDAEHHANRLDDQVQSLRGQNNTLADTVHHLRSAHLTAIANMNQALQQRDELLRTAQNVSRNSGTLTAGLWRELGAAIKNCVPVAETVATICAAANYALSRLDKRLERAHDESDYDTAVAVRDAARSLTSACGITHMEASAMVAELETLDEGGGPLDDVDDPGYNYASHLDAAAKPAAKGSAPC